MAVAIVIDVLKQFRTGQVAASLQYLRELAIANDASMAYAALGAKIEFDLATPNSHVVIPKRGQAEAVVLPGILGGLLPEKRHENELESVTERRRTHAGESIQRRADHRDIA